MLTDEEILKFLMDKYNSLKDFVCQLHFEGVITTNQSNILLNKIILAIFHFAKMSIYSYFLSFIFINH